MEQQQMLENMCAWGEYKLEYLNDAQKRAEICGVSISEIRQDVKGIILVQPLEAARRQAKEILEHGPWPYFYFTNKGKGGIRRKTYLKDTKTKGRMPTNLWVYDEVGHTDGAKKELKTIFNGNIPFDTPKPTALLGRILQIATKDDSLILDFFAGSGTTGHSVLKYNMEHPGSQRRFILCTNNENNICEEVTFERIRKVIQGYGSVPGIPSNLKYYRTEFVPKDIDNVSEALLSHIAEMIQLEHGVKIDDSNYLMVMSDDEADTLEQHWEEYPDMKALYISKNVLLTTKQNTLFRNVDIHIIPDDYFKFEMQEVGESW